MNLTTEDLMQTAAVTGFQEEVLEKVIRLIGLLNGIQRHPFLRPRLVLKGGTALNLFLFEFPRLSVDIDLNYIGAVQRDGMLAEREPLQRALRAVCEGEELTPKRIPADHAGGKWRLSYCNAFGRTANLDLDLNFALRVPLWPINHLDSHPLGIFQAKRIPVVDVHELAARKLAALLSRVASRDLFDVSQLLDTPALLSQKLRLAFVVYGGINRRDWRDVGLMDLRFEINEVKRSLIPVLRRGIVPVDLSLEEWIRRMMDTCREGVRWLTTLETHELAFLDALNEHGEIRPEFLTQDESLVA